MLMRVRNLTMKKKNWISYQIKWARGRVPVSEGVSEDEALAGI
jgi:hypothetical protein